jgi:general secretion pathway protein H
MRKKHAGFTLLEIMVVIVIMGTIMGIAIPQMNNLFSVNLKSSIRKLSGAILFCFNESVIKQAPLRLNFNLDTGEYWLTFLAVRGSTGEFVVVPNDVFDHEQLPPGVFFKDIITPHNIEKQQEGEVFISFYPTGFTERAVIHMTTRRGEVFTLVVKPLTGKTVVYDREIDFIDVSPQFSGGGFGQGN